MRTKGKVHSVETTKMEWDKKLTPNGSAHAICHSGLAEPVSLVAGGAPRGVGGSARPPRGAGAHAAERTHREGAAVA